MRASMRRRSRRETFASAGVASTQLADAAGPGGVLPLNVATGTIIGRIVGTVRRIPTVGEDVVIADGPTVETALSAVAPGSGTPNEVWLDSPDGHEQETAAALRRRPFDAREMEWHDALR